MNGDPSAYQRMYQMTQGDPRLREQVQRQMAAMPVQNPNPLTSAPWYDQNQPYGGAATGGQGMGMNPLAALMAMFGQMGGQGRGMRSRRRKGTGQPIEQGPGGLVGALAGAPGARVSMTSDPARTFQGWLDEGAAERQAAAQPQRRPSVYGPSGPLNFLGRFMGSRWQ